jgi:uncharacterized membrane protein
MLLPILFFRGIGYNKRKLLREFVPARSRFFRCIHTQRSAGGAELRLAPDFHLLSREDFPMVWNADSGRILTTFFLSMVPVVELRGAIPIAVAGGIPLPAAILISVLGNLLPVPFIILFIRKILAWLRKRGGRAGDFAVRLEARAERKADIVRRYAFWGLALFVAVPLPGTGAWTGALIAAMLQMRLKQAFPSIALGVTAAGLLVASVTYGAEMLVFA